MHEWQSLSHVGWDCKYHVVIIPKYRRKVFYGRLRRQIGTILQDLCRQRGVEMLEGHAMPDHIHLCLTGRLKTNIAGVLAGS
jgi:putative transposase